MDTQMRISSILPRSVAHGPGQRFVVWVQGCTLACKGCFSPHTHSLHEGRLIDVDELVSQVLETHGIEGITLTGGEPMQQAAALASLSKTVKRHGLSVMCYTGFTLRQIETHGSEAMRALVNCLDILVDGPFVLDKTAQLRWRGSRNQQIHFLASTYRHRHRQNDAEEITSIELILSDQGFTTTGIWPTDVLQRLEEIVS